MDSSRGDPLSSSTSRPRVRAVLRLGGESYAVESGGKGVLSQKLVEVKEESMKILKSFMASHHVSDEVPDDLADSSGEDDGQAPDDNPPKKSKK